MSRITQKNGSILVAIDFSKTSDYALARAVAIAKERKANLTVLHIVQKQPMDNFLDSTFKKILSKKVWLTTVEYKEMQLREKIEAFSRHKVNINYIIVSKGSPAEKILHFSKKNKVDLLVIGAHSKHFLRDTFVGTSAEYIAKKTKYPVLIVKNPAQTTYRKILVPVDFSKPSKEALAYTLKFFPKSIIRLLHIGDYDYEILLKKEEMHIAKVKVLKIRKAIQFYLENKIRKFIAEYSKKLNKNAFIFKLGYPGPTIIQEAKKLKSDLIVMGTQGHGRNHYIFIGSVANWVLLDTNKDLLLIPRIAK